MYILIAYLACQLQQTADLAATQQDRGILVADDICDVLLDQSAGLCRVEIDLVLVQLPQQLHAGFMWLLLEWCVLIGDLADCAF